MGLNEPIAEIALDDGVGIGMMVRNAFAFADNVHMRATEAACPSSAGADGSPMHQQEVGQRDPDIDNNQNERQEAEDIDEFQTEPLQPNRSNSRSENPSEHVRQNVDGGSSEEEDSTNLQSENGGEADNSSDSSRGSPWEASDDEDSDEEDLEELLGQIPEDRMGSNSEFDIAATLPLYEGITLSMLCATLLIVNCCKTHGVSNTFLNELLVLLSMSILPVGNCLPKTEYEASKILRRLGLAYNMIHACPNGCCLFKGDLEDVEKCPVCEQDRYRRCGRSRVPTLILRHFPLIPQLQRMFSSKKLSKLNVWHYFNKSVDGKMRHTADCPQWNFVNTELEPEAGNEMFGRDPRDMHLGLALDGMNPHLEKRSTQSLTPVIVFNYNLPPWRTKLFCER